MNKDDIISFIDSYQESENIKKCAKALFLFLCAVKDQQLVDYITIPYIISNICDKTFPRKIVEESALFLCNDNLDILEVAFHYYPHTLEDENCFEEMDRGTALDSINNQVDPQSGHYDADIDSKIELYFRGTTRLKGIITQ